MSKILNNLKPSDVFSYFEDICDIPHGSRNTKEISDYCVAFAKEHHLDYIQDEYNNVIIRKAASKGYEDHDTVMIQGHLDMVNEKTADSLHDFDTEGLTLKIDGDYVMADNTTLGGDDGIAIAYALAVLADDTLAHPAIEAVFTVDEEIGLLGATALDCSGLKAKYLLNVDSEEEGIFLSSCAGGITASLELPVEYEGIEGVSCNIIIDGLLGGHSGSEIDKGRANAHVLLGRMLYALNEEVPYAIVSIKGGGKDNAIASYVNMEILVEKDYMEALEKILHTLNENFLEEYKGTDDGIRITLIQNDEKQCDAIIGKSKMFITYLLMNIPNGIVKMSHDIKGLVETSLNCGILELDDTKFRLGFAVRSSKASSKYALCDRLRFLVEFIGGEITFEGDYPGWKYEENSRLRQIMCQEYRKLYGKEAKVEAIHAGLECGIFADKMPGIDMISFGPDMKDIHTPKERLSVSSVARTWELIKAVLAAL